MKGFIQTAVLATLVACGGDSKKNDSNGTCVSQF
jgi:hypothetical protein